MLLAENTAVMKRATTPKRSNKSRPPRQSRPASKRPAAITEFTNIRVLPSGFQVTLTRSGLEFSRHFAGHSEESRRAAIQFRDKALRELPPKRLNDVPRPVLKALGLSSAVVGVFRTPKREMYQVGYRDAGKQRTRAFSWSWRSEVDAYAAAVAFRHEIIAKEAKRASSRAPRTQRASRA